MSSFIVANTVLTLRVSFPLAAFTGILGFVARHMGLCVAIVRISQTFATSDVPQASTTRHLAATEQGLTITVIDSLSIERGGYIAASQASGRPEGKSRRDARVASKIDSRRRWVLAT